MNKWLPPSIRTRAGNVLWIAIGLLPYFIAGLLFLAAALKSYSALTGAVLPSELTLAHRFTGPLLAIEACMAVWIISGATPRLSWASTLILFVSFAIANLVAAFRGDASCGCLGPVVAPAWAMALADCAVVGAVLRSRQQWHARRCIALSGPILVGAGAVASLLIAAGILVSAGASAATMVARLTGAPAVVNPSVLDAGTGPRGERLTLRVAVSNLSDEPMRLTGGTTSCSCATIGDLPLTIEPHTTREISVEFTRSASSATEVRYQLFTDRSGFSVLLGRIRSRIRE